VPLMVVGLTHAAQVLERLPTNAVLFAQYPDCSVMGPGPALTTAKLAVGGTVHATSRHWPGTRPPDEGAVVVQTVPTDDGTAAHPLDEGAVAADENAMLIVAPAAVAVEPRLQTGRRAWPPETQAAPSVRSTPLTAALLTPAPPFHWHVVPMQVKSCWQFPGIVVLQEALMTFAAEPHVDRPLAAERSDPPLDPPPQDPPAQVWFRSPISAGGIWL